MTLGFNQGIGFNVYHRDSGKQEVIFSMIRSLLMRIDWRSEGAYFNYENYQEQSKNHAKVWIRSKKRVEDDIKNILRTGGFTEKSMEDQNNTTPYYTFFSNLEGNLNNFENGTYLRLKEDGTKYAIEIINELDITPQNFDQKMDKIAKIVTVKSRLIIKTGTPKDAIRALTKC